MDNKMVDNEERRAQRKKLTLTPEQAANRYPNRRERRAQAKRRGLFRHRGAWGHTNTGRPKNVSIRKNDSDSPELNQ